MANIVKEIKDLQGKEGISTPSSPIIKDEVLRNINRIKMFLFPGFFEQVVGEGTSYLKTLLAAIRVSLNEQITLAFKLNKIKKSPKEVKEIVEMFLETLPRIKEYLHDDITAIEQGDPACTSKAEIIIAYPGFFATLVYRITHELYVLNIPLLPRIMSEHAHSLTGIDIHPGASIGRKFFIDHGTGVVIGETTIIGEEVKIYQGVTLGAISLKEGNKLKGVKRHPTIKNRVIIYSGASILGGDTVIGENVTIGSNTFITSSIDDNKLVILKNPEIVVKDQKNHI